MAPSRPNHSNRPAHVRLKKISAEPLNDQQRQQAVTALAALIGAWQHRKETSAIGARGGPRAGASPSQPGERH